MASPEKGDAKQDCFKTLGEVRVRNTTGLLVMAERYDAVTDA
jgi:hypothetical protein